MSLLAGDPVELVLEWLSYDAEQQLCLDERAQDNLRATWAARVTESGAGQEFERLLALAVFLGGEKGAPRAAADLLLTLAPFLPALRAESEQAKDGADRQRAAFARFEGSPPAAAPSLPNVPKVLAGSLAARQGLRLR